MHRVNVCRSGGNQAEIPQTCGAGEQMLHTHHTITHIIYLLIKHILPYISATEPLIHYCIFFFIKTLNFPVL